jgi:hypothetical protein
METRLSILFFAKSKRKKSDEQATIYLRVTINGTRFEVSTHRDVDRSKWSTEAGRMKGSSEDAKRLNLERFIGDLAQKEGLTPKEVEQKFFLETRPLSLLQRFITPEEVAGAVLYLCSDLAGATNGAAMRVDGGILKGLH